MGPPENFPKAFANQEIFGTALFVTIFFGGGSFAAATEKGFPLLSLVQKYRFKTIIYISLKKLYLYSIENQYMKGQNKLFFAIIIALVLGVIIGGVVHTQFPENTESFSKNIKLLGTIFIRLVQMIIAPLVFTTLVVGIAKMGDTAMIGRVGGKAMLWFITASLVSLMLGLVLVNWLEPGHVTKLPIQDANSAKEILDNSKGFSLEDFVKHVVPKSVFEAFATNEVLQIVLFSIMFGIALSHLGDEYSKPVINF